MILILANAPFYHKSKILGMVSISKHKVIDVIQKYIQPSDSIILLITEEIPNRCDFAWSNTELIVHKKVRTVFL